MDRKQLKALAERLAQSAIASMTDDQIRQELSHLEFMGYQIPDDPSQHREFVTRISAADQYREMQTTPEILEDAPIPVDALDDIQCRDDWFLV